MYIHHSYIFYRVYDRGFVLHVYSHRMPNNMYRTTYNFEISLALLNRTVCCSEAGACYQVYAEKRQVSVSPSPPPPPPPFSVPMYTITVHIAVLNSCYCSKSNCTGTTIPIMMNLINNWKGIVNNNNDMTMVNIMYRLWYLCVPAPMSLYVKEQCHGTEGSGIFLKIGSIPLSP